MFPVKELPHENTGGVQAESTTGITVKEDRPVVKLLPEHDVWIAYGFVTVLQVDTLPSVCCLQHTCQGNAGFGSVYEHRVPIVSADSRGNHAPVLKPSTITGCNLTAIWKIDM